MRTYDHGFSGDKKVRRKKKNNSGLEGVQRYIASLSKEQISRMISDAGKPYVPKGADVTGRAIYENELRQNGLIQPKLEISNPQDKAEQQADKVAEGVMKGDATVSQKVLSEKATSEISTKGDGDVTQTTDSFDGKLQGTKGQGQKLDTIQRKELESHTGTDLSSVNIHTNSNASEMSESINAKAFTHGQDIYFKEGQYNPSSNEGKSLLAHEVAHTVQQKNGVQRMIQRQTSQSVTLNTNSTLPGANTFGTNSFTSKVNGQIKSFKIKNGFMSADILVSGVKAKCLKEIQVCYFTPTTGKPGGKEITVGAKKYQGFVDGGRNCPDVTIAGGEVGDATRPYLYGPSMTAAKAAYEKKWTGTSGNTVMTDAPQAVIDYSEFYFETYVVASEYNGTKNDKVLAMFKWGFTGNGAIPIHTGAVNLVLTSKLSETAATIIKNDGYDYAPV
ncbi:MAG: DUF4157 domain-containing protein [Bacteroidia bacterium]